MTTISRTNQLTQHAQNIAQTPQQIFEKSHDPDIDADQRELMSVNHSARKAACQFIEAYAQGLEHGVNGQEPDPGNARTKHAGYCAGHKDGLKFRRRADRHASGPSDSQAYDPNAERDAENHEEEEEENHEDGDLNQAQATPLTPLHQQATGNEAHDDYELQPASLLTETPARSLAQDRQPNHEPIWRSRLLSPATRRSRLAHR